MTRSLALLYLLLHEILSLRFSLPFCAGNARTSLIITVSPSARHYSQTSSTIMFGQRVGISNFLGFPKYFMQACFYLYGLLRNQFLRQFHFLSVAFYCISFIDGHSLLRFLQQDGSQLCMRSFSQYISAFSNFPFFAPNIY